MKQSGDGVVLVVGDVQCRECGTRFVFDGDPQSTRGGGRAKLPLRAVEYNAAKLFCDACGKRVFGPNLDRTPIVALDCRGVVHRVEFDDGVVCEYTPGAPPVVIRDEQEATTSGEDCKAQEAQ